MIDKLMRVIVDDPSLLQRTPYVFHALQEVEDKILCHYFSLLYQESINITESTLDSVLTNSEIKRWFWTKSIAREEWKHPVEDADLMSKLSIQIKSPADREQALYNLLLIRFEEIMNTPKVDAMEKEGVLRFAKENANSILAREFHLLSQELIMKGFVYYKRVKYEAKDFVTLMERFVTSTSDMLAKVDDGASSLLQASTSMFKDVVVSSGAAFHWQLSLVDVGLPELDTGQVGVVLGAEKVGKTRFSLGEVAYPTIQEGNTVGYISGEMSNVDLLTMLTIKYIYKSTGRRLQFKIVRAVIACMHDANKLQLSVPEFIQLLKKEDILPEKGIDGAVKEIAQGMSFSEFIPLQKEFKNIIKELEEINNAYVEMISLYFNQLMNDPDMGRLLVLESSEYFDVDSFPTAIRALKKKNPKLKLVVIDHLGFMTSKTLDSDSKVQKEIMSTCKMLAKQLGIAFWVVNHLETKANEDIAKGKVTSVKGVRGHGSSAPEKFADMVLILWATPEDSLEGITRLHFKVSRWVENPGDYKMQTNLDILEYNII